MKIIKLSLTISLVCFTASFSHAAPKAINYLFSPDGRTSNGAWIGNWGSSKGSRYKDEVGLNIIKLEGSKLGWGFHNHKHLNLDSIPDGAVLNLKYRCLNMANPGQIIFSWRMAAGGEKRQNLVNANYTEKFKAINFPLRKIPAFFCFQNVGPKFFGDLIETSSNQPLLSIYAAKNENKVTLIEINTSPDTCYTSQLQGIEGYKHISGVRLTQTNNQEQIGDTNQFPPYSITTMVKQK